MRDSLFGHLAFQFSTSPENLATEALNYILNGSKTARESFASLLERINIHIPSNLKYETQDKTNEDPSIPDLVGKDADNFPRILGEAKFWAGLTDNQPVTYLRRMEHNGGIALIFFVPAKRIPTIYPELQRRCRDAGIPLYPERSSNSEILSARVIESKSLVIMSWRALLATIHQALVAEGETNMAGNVVQLQGLCDRMDESAFLPLQSEELSSSISLRLIQYSELVDEVANYFIQQKIAHKGGLHAVGNRFGYIQYLLMQNQAVSIEFNASLWNKYRATPLWLGIKSNDWKYDPVAKEKLIVLELEEPPRLFKEKDTLYIPLFMKTGVEKADVVANVVKQIVDIFKLLE